MTEKYLQVIPAGPIETNCYIFGCPVQKEAVVIDPGGDCDKIYKLIQKSGMTIKAIINTHCHWDHVGANHDLQAILGNHPPILIHPKEKDRLSHGSMSETYTLNGVESNGGEPGGFLNDGDVITVGNLSLTVLDTPGHSAGSISLYCEDVVFSGDALFQLSIGRTDFADASYSQLIHSIKTKLFTLPDDTIVYPGHGESSIIAIEKQYNPYLRD